jgi:excisionase family DNA binding protein
MSIHPSRRILPNDPLADAGRALVALGEAILAMAHEQPTAASDPAQLLDARQIAELIGVSVSEVRRLITTEEITSVRVGRLVRVSRAELERWIESRQKRPADREAASHWGLGA